MTLYFSAFTRDLFRTSPTVIRYSYYMIKIQNKFFIIVLPSQSPSVEQMITTLIIILILYDHISGFFFAMFICRDFFRNVLQFNLLQEFSVKALLSTGRTLAYFKNSICFCGFLKYLIHCYIVPPTRCFRLCHFKHIYSRKLKTKISIT